MGYSRTMTNINGTRGRNSGMQCMILQLVESDGQFDQPSRRADYANASICTCTPSEKAIPRTLTVRQGLKSPFAYEYSIHHIHPPRGNLSKSYSHNLDRILQTQFRHNVHTHQLFIDQPITIQFLSSSGDSPPESITLQRKE